ncbi:MAG: dehydrogenase [Rhodospirillales bacterium 20-58-10]|nr:MAG: dehydrogenase [Rhodospirillales bacterium 20-58-10]
MSGVLSGRTAIITGAAQGIGAAYAFAMAAEGAKLSLCDMAAPGETAAAIRGAGGAAIAFACDITDRQAVEAMAAATMSEYGGIQILVNNAGIFAALALKPAEQIEGPEWDRVMAVNVRGSFECARAVIPAMRTQGYGKIINIASGTVFKGAPMMLHYVASKGAVVAMTRSLARELGKDGIRVNCLAPGLTMSAGVQSNSDWSATISAANIASRCLQREAAPEDLTGTLIHLASAGSDFMTGQTVVVDGGSVTH